MLKFLVMWIQNLWFYVIHEVYALKEWAKCGESAVSVVPTVLWAAGAAMLTQRALASLFRRALFRREPLWELVLQHLLFSWMVLYSLHFWTLFVRVIKVTVQFCYDDVVMTSEESEGREVMQQWVIWMCGAAPLALYAHTRPRPGNPPFMIWITTSPWQRREMGPYGYYLNRPLPSLQFPATTDRRHTLAFRRAFSDSKIILKDPPKRKRYSKSV